jgi:hypothetical protein
VFLLVFSLYTSHYLLRLLFNNANKNLKKKIETNTLMVVITSTLTALKQAFMPQNMP